MTDHGEIPSNNSYGSIREGFAEPPDPLSAFLERARVWLLSALAIGLFASAFLHLSGLLVAQHVRFGWGFSTKTSPEGPGGPIGLAVVTEGELAELQAGPLAINAPAVGEIAPSDVGGKALDNDAPSALGDVGSGAGDIGDLGPGLSSASDIGTGVGQGLGAGGGGGGGGASFFGVEAAGSRFAFIVDVSGSMSVGGKIEALRGELGRSIASLLQNSHFLVVPFSTDASPMGGKPQWTEANDRGKLWGSRSVEVLKADGGTNPFPAFAITFNIRPRPDAIYFMTDGEFPAQTANDIAALNAQAKIPIHAICFVSQGAEDIMKQIARESGGTYTYIPGPRP